MKLHILALMIGILLSGTYGADIFANGPTKNQLVEAMNKDERKPSKANISGAWSSGPNLTGYTVQLEQRGEAVTGRGYYWGCLGIYDIFLVTGSYKKGLLSLTFTTSPRKHSKILFKVSEDDGKLRFTETTGKVRWRIIPYSEPR